MGLVYSSCCSSAAWAVYCHDMSGHCAHWGGPNRWRCINCRALLVRLSQFIHRWSDSSLSPVPDQTSEMLS